MAAKTDIDRSESPSTLVEGDYQPVPPTSSTTGSGFGTEALCHAVKTNLETLSRFQSVTWPQQQITNLWGQIKDLDILSYDLDQEASSRRRGQRSTLSQADHLHLHQLWDSVEISSERCCNDALGPLQERLKKIIGPHPDPTRYDETLILPREQLEFYDSIFQSLRYKTAALRMLQMAINLSVHKTHISEDGKPSKRARDDASTLSALTEDFKSQLRHATEFYSKLGYDDALLDMRNALSRAESVIRSLPTTSMNMHYRVPRNANPIYTGRRRQLQIIADAFSSELPNTQKRFIVQGTPGSGKTDLALKYAEEHLMFYWGVFWLDASTRANAAASFAEIAKAGGVEPQERAAKHWLSHTPYTWLLIIDNADDDEVTLTDLFPMGTQGCVLVTTRNPGHKIHGNCGHGWLQLGEMEHGEANELLLRAADHPKPWTGSPMELATSICKHLHYLPLALVHAGKAILEGLASLVDYIDFFESHAQWIRRVRHRRRDRSSSWSRHRTKEDNENMPVFGSYEILYQSLEGSASSDETKADALQLLHVFSYMHFQNIRLDVLVHSAVCPLLELEAAAQTQKEEQETLERLGVMVPRQSWRAWIQNVIMSVRRTRLFASPPIVPDVLKNPDELDAEDLQKEVTVRLRRALNVLVSRSLVARGEGRDRGKEGHHHQHHRNHNHMDCYHMHPLVHKWVRERPQLSVAEEALHCQTTTTILWRAIRIQGKDTEHEMAMRRDMKPHIDHVHNYAEVIRLRLQENCKRDKSVFFGLFRRHYHEPLAHFSPERAQECARFGRVYLECSAFVDAERLMRQAHDFVISRLGECHSYAQALKQALAEIMWHLTRHNDAANMLREVYLSRKHELGTKHPKTIDITNKLGGAVLSQGRITESLGLHEAAYQSLVEAYGPHHKETLKCVDQIGSVYYFYFDWKQSVDHHRRALEGMQALKGTKDEPDELDVLTCMEHVAMASIQLDQTQFDEAKRLMRHVMERRIELLGKEAPFTLVAKARYGRVLAACKRHDEADKLMDDALQAAIRNHGHDNLAVNAGKCWYAQVLLQMRELERAEKLLRDATVKSKYAKAAAPDGEHPDRILAAWYLCECLELQGKYDEALSLCRELQFNVPRVGGHGLGAKHKFAGMLPGKIAVLEGKIAGRDRTGRTVEDDGYRDWMGDSGDGVPLRRRGRHVLGGFVE